MHLIFEPTEQDGLRAEAREHVVDDPAVAYVLERLAAEGVDLDTCADWEAERLHLGLEPRRRSNAA